MSEVEVASEESEAGTTPLRRRGIRALVAVLVAVLAGVLVVTLTGGAGPEDEFVTRNGTQLEIDGAPFRFVGFNLYDAAATDIYSCSPTTRLDDAGLDRAMAQIRDAGGTVVRFWAFQTYTDGGTNYAGVDRVIAAARAHDLRVMPVLEDGPGSCSTGAAFVHLSAPQQGDWYSTGYREPLGDAAVSFREYVGRITAHYRDEPTVVAWSLVNEAETERRQADGTSVLVAFAEDLAGIAHAAAPRHLVTLGTQSNGAPGTSGSDFTDIYSLPGMDLTEVHDWGHYGGDRLAMPGAPETGGLPAPEDCQDVEAEIACSFTLARELDKPIIVGEVGIRITKFDGSPGDRDTPTAAERAGLLADKIEAAFEAGASGYLVWQLNRVNTDGYGVLIGSNDPTFGVLEDAARRWGSTP